MRKNRLLYVPTRAEDPAWLMLMREAYRERKTWEKWLEFRLGLLTKWLHERGDLVCEYCGKPGLQRFTEGVSRSEQATLDHVIPRSQGVCEYDVSNLVVACRVCNERKGSQSVSEYLSKNNQGE